MKYSIPWTTVMFLLAWAHGAAAQPLAIDTQTSVLTVRVNRAGLLSVLGHDHEIAAPLAGGNVDAAAHRVELHVDAKALRVQDPNTSEKDRGEIQMTMLGPEVLDVARYPEIVFRSTVVEAASRGAWKIRGNLTLHGQERPVTVDVIEKAGHYTGTAILKQADFGIKPIKVGGGAVRVKDEVRIEFDIQLAR